MKHNINASQTRKAELNVHPLGLISKFHVNISFFHNANRLKPRKINLDFLNVRFNFYLLKDNKKEMSKYHTCAMYAVSFAVADAKHSTDSETAVQRKSQAQKNHEL